jgi:hypothetical protein
VLLEDGFMPYPPSVQATVLGVIVVAVIGQFVVALPLSVAPVPQLKSIVLAKALGVAAKATTANARAVRDTLIFELIIDLQKTA